MNTLSRNINKNQERNKGLYHVIGYILPLACLSILRMIRNSFKVILPSQIANIYFLDYTELLATKIYILKSLHN